MGGRQPGLHGHHARLGPEANDHQTVCHQQQRLVLCSPGEIDGPTRLKIRHRQVIGDKEVAGQGHARAEYGIPQVFEACPAGRWRGIVQHQRHRNQGHHLEEHIHGHEVGRLSKAHQYPQRHGIKSHELVALPRMADVGFCKDHHRRPDAHCQHHEELGQPVAVQHQAQVPLDGQQPQPLGGHRAVSQHHHGGNHDQRHHQPVTVSLIFLPEYEDPADQRHQNRQQQQHGRTPSQTTSLKSAGHPPRSGL